ncbi:uncharacterized protein C17orf50 homolog [Dendropsophus ebraccatus]|uniref:uncharacterized protein C17orf50 homolog n=1 Tax=Dendropsophus ebraccatus TaxID=150705 RepID=UPI0038312B8E
MSCVRPPAMARLDDSESDEEGSILDASFGHALCCGRFLWSCFTPEESPQAQRVRTPEEQTTATSDPGGPGLERRPSLLEGLMEAIRASLSLRRKSQIETKKLICCLLEPKSRPELCLVCPILLCPACETLHCQPNYIQHCLLEHPIPPTQAPDVHRPPIIQAPAHPSFIIQAPAHPSSIIQAPAHPSSIIQAPAHPSSIIQAPAHPLNPQWPTDTTALVT